MSTRKSISNEHLAKVLEFTIRELQKDLETQVNKQKTLLINHAGYIKNELSKDISVDTGTFQAIIENFEHRFNHNIQSHVVALEKQKKELRLVYISSIFFLLGIVCLLVSYFFGIQGADKIRTDYYEDLKNSGQIIENKQDQEFIKSWKKWTEKNPKDSERLRTLIFNQKRNNRRLFRF